MTPPAAPTWLQSLGVGVGLTISHAYLYLRDARADLAQLLVKGAPLMSTTSPIVNALQQDLPALIAGTKAIMKTLLDTIYTTGTAAEKAAQLTAQLQPAFDAEMTKLGLPTWADGMLNTVFATLVARVVADIEAVTQPTVVVPGA